MNFENVIRKARVTVANWLDPRPLRSPYSDSTQIGISCEGTFTQASFEGSELPQISGLTRVYKSFKPVKAVLTELVTATFTGPELPDLTLTEAVVSASDLVLINAFAGADSCFPNAPADSNGIAGDTFCFNSLGNGISWPTIDKLVDMTVAFAVEASVLNRASWWYNSRTDSNPVAKGYNLLPSRVHVKARFNLLGPSIR